MESSGSNNGTATAVREGGATEHHAHAALLPHVSESVVSFLPASTPSAVASPGDLLQQRTGPAAQRARSQPRCSPWEAIGPSGPEPTPAREYAYTRLKALVLSGRFAPGQRLAEERLSRDLGISRTPIREALHKLQLEGLITSLSTRGFAASRDSQAETEELVDLRAVLEGYALRIICDRLTEQQLGKLEEIVRRTVDAVESQRLADVSRWNARFHSMLHTLVSDKRRIHQQLVTMRQYVFRYGEGTPPSVEDGRWTVEGHRRILTALRFRDPDLCECAMREHIRRSQGNGLRPEADPFHGSAVVNRFGRRADNIGRA